MVWIHGGGLVVGAATYYDGSALSAYENVVVVGIQYRLGVLGFFSTGDEHARGNWGFLDQVAALQWVQENIASFGGDPDSVTIFGESAGGTSVSAQNLSPLSNGLFHRAISESGVIYQLALCTSNPAKVTNIRNVIANFSDCETSSEALVSCLREKTEEEILDITLKSKLPFIPAVVDGVFFPKSAEKLLTGQEYHPVPYLLGVNINEGSWIIPIVFCNLSNIIEVMDKEKARELLSIFMVDFVPKHVDLYIDEYISNSAKPNEVKIGFLELLGDVWFDLPTVEVARLHRESAQPVYLYEFQHGPSTCKNSRPDYVKTDHTDEIGFVFGAPFLNNDNQWLENSKYSYRIAKQKEIVAGITKEEKRLSRNMMSYWANFARKGNPNGDGLHEWPVFGHQEKHLEISLQPKVGNKLKNHRIKMWTETYPKRVNALMQGKKEHSEL